MQRPAQRDHDLPTRAGGPTSTDAATRNATADRDLVPGREDVTFTPLLARFHRFLAQMGRMHDAKSPTALFQSARRAISELLDVRHCSVLTRMAGGRFVPLPIDESGHCSGPGEESLGELIAHAFAHNRAVFDEVELSAAGDMCTVCVLPVVAGPTSHCVMLLWVAEDISSVDVLQYDLLTTLAHDLGARHGALLQAEKHLGLASLFDNIIESVPQAVVAVSGDRRIVAINANAEFLFGVKRIFAMEEPFNEVLPARVVTAFEGLISRSLIRGETGDTGLELKLPDGTTLHIGISISLLRDRRGNKQGYLFLCRDMSLSQEVEKLRELDQMKSEFVNTVSHELKTPLTAILGGLEVIGSDDKRIPADVAEMLDLVGRGAERLKSLIFDLLDVSRLETGRVTLRDDVVAIADLIHEVLSGLPVAPRHRYRVEVEADVPKVIMDRNKIFQCLTNYISNAVKYSPQGGDITIRAFVDRERHALAVAVTDTGLGLTPENQKKVWQKFYRVDAGYTQEIEGTGLGLVIVQRIIELHGGSVGVDSELGKGSTFWFRIPCALST